MLDPVFTQRLDQLLAAAHRARVQPFRDELRQITFDSARRGITQSSIHASNMFRAHEREIQWHAQTALDVAKRVQSALRPRPSDDFRRDLQVALQFQLRSALPVLERSLHENIGQLPRANQDFSLSPALSRASDWLSSEIDVYMDQLMNSSSDERAHNLHFHAPVAAVQTGAHATASVVQNVGSPELSALLRSLEDVRAAIIQAEELDEVSKRELTQIAEDCGREAGVAQPNGTRLGALFNVLATAIQAIANARPAYLAMRTALTPFGISLP